MSPKYSSYAGVGRPGNESLSSSVSVCSCVYIVAKNMSLTRLELCPSTHCRVYVTETCSKSILVDAINDKCANFRRRNRHL